MKLVGAISVSLALLAGCGGDDLQEVTGVVRTFAASSCDGAVTEVEDIAGKQLTVRDGDGTVIATTTTEEDPELDETKFDDVCDVAVGYVVDVPTSDFYEIELEGVEGQPEPISFDELEATGFTYDLRVTTSD